MNTSQTLRPEERRAASDPSMTGSKALIESFLQEGVETVFGYPGGAIIPVYDALYDYRDRLRHILVRHEQGAVHAAQGYARVSGRVGVCLVTSGPGRHEHRDGAGRRADGLHAAGARHRTSRLRAAGHRRLSGDQFRRHHAGRHQVELPGQAHRRHSRGHRQGLLHRPLGPSGPRRGRHHQGRTMRDGPVPLRKDHLDPQLRPRARTRRGTHRRSGTADRRSPAGRW